MQNVLSNQCNDEETTPTKCSTAAAKSLSILSHSWHTWHRWYSWHSGHTLWHSGHPWYGWHCLRHTYCWWYAETVLRHALSHARHWHVGYSRKTWKARWHT